MDQPVTLMPSDQKSAERRLGEPVILPSLLMCDFGNLEREIERLEAAGVGGFHLDVMDGHFVPNLTYGMPIVAACRRLTDLPLDVHLMIDDPGRYLEQFRQAGADILTIHAEAAEEPARLLEEIRALGASAGLAFNPDTPLSKITDCLDLCDLVLPMSVIPGFGGQAFDPTTIDKLACLANQVRYPTVLEVDGGINQDTISECAAAGASWFVVGSAIFESDDYKTTVDRLRRLAGQKQLE